jgi:hypothetical protein
MLLLFFVILTYAPVHLPTAANREKFLAAAASAPGDFSQVQMSTYLTASKFRQTIEKHKKALGGGLQGPQEAGEALQVRGKPCRTAMPKTMQHAAVRACACVHAWGKALVAWHML